MNTYTIELLGDMVDVRQASKERLEDIKVQLEADMASIKNQIDFAKSGARVGEYADPEWFARVNAARRHKGRQINLINAELKKRKDREMERRKRAAVADSLTFERAFMRVTKAWVGETDYATLCNAAQELIRAQEG